MFLATDSKKRFEEPNLFYLRDFILNNQVADTDSIAVDSRIFDELALDYRKQYNEPIPIPFIFLGVWIKIADLRTVSQNTALILRDDPRPDERPSQGIPIYKMEGPYPEATVYRCGYCGSLIDQHGYGLQGDVYEAAMKRWKELGPHIFTPSVGKCCERKPTE